MADNLMPDTQDTAPPHATPEPQGDIYIDYLPIDDIKLAERNPRTHALERIRESITEHGFLSAMLLNETTGRLVCGHGRIKTLKDMQAAGEPPPERGVKIKDGKWCAIVQRGVWFDTDADAEAYLLADNQLSNLAKWQDEMLADMLRDIKKTRGSLLGTGFREIDQDKLDKTLGRKAQMMAGEDDGTEQVARADALQEKWQVQVGDVWQVGKHRIMCGDSTNPEHVKTLLEGVTPSLIVTDPPYGVKYDATWRGKAFLETNNLPSTKPIENDQQVDWTSVYSLWAADVMYIWHASIYNHIIANNLEGINYKLKSVIIWNKNNHVIGRGHYHWKHEMCLYVVKKGAKANWQGARDQMTVWDIPTRFHPEHAKDEADKFDGNHMSQKPVELFRRPIKNNSQEGDVVCEPFSGTGSCLVAAEQTGRVCYAMELTRKYVAVALERLTELGLEAKRVSAL